MAKLKMIVELDYEDDAMHGENKDAYHWFIIDVLGAAKGDRGLILHSNEIGDEVGTIELISILP